MSDEFKRRKLKMRVTIHPPVPLPVAGLVIRPATPVPLALAPRAEQPRPFGLARKLPYIHHNPPGLH